MNIAKDNTQTVEKLHNRYTTALNSQAKMNRATSSHPSNTGNHRASSHELHAQVPFYKSIFNIRIHFGVLPINCDSGTFHFHLTILQTFEMPFHQVGIFVWRVIFWRKVSAFQKGFVRRLVEKCWPRSFPLKVSPQGGSSPSLRGARPIQYKKFANLVVFYSDFGHDFPQDKTCFFAD